MSPGCGKKKRKKKGEEKSNLRRAF